MGERMNVAHGFSTAVAAKLGRVTPPMLDNWDRTGLLHPSVASPRRGVSRMYTFRDVVAIRVASDLRKAGISIQGIRRVVRYLCKRKGLTSAEALATTHLVTDGRDVYEVVGEQSVSALRRPGQHVLFVVPIGEVATEIENEARALGKAA